MTTYCHVEPLPAGYRLQEVLAFHQRDAQQLAEQVTTTSAGLPLLRKGLDWQSQPAWLELEWEHAPATAPTNSTSIPPTKRRTTKSYQATAAAKAAPTHMQKPEGSALQVRATLYLPATAGRAQADRDRWPGVVRRMLGLAYAPEALEAAHAQHPQLGHLLRSQTGLHVPASPTPWEALTWAITGQQISVAAAVSLRRKLIVAAGTQLDEGAGWSADPSPLLTYPNAAQVAQLGAEGLRAAGYSQSKTRALLALAELVTSGALPLDAWVQASDAGQLQAKDVDAAAQQLLAVPGIGPWTVHYTLLRGLGWPDGSLHGDVAVRKALAHLLGMERMTEAQTRDWLAPFAPWRALVAAHLWVSLSAKAY